MIALKSLALALAILVAVPLAALLVAAIFFLLPEARSYLREGARLLLSAIRQVRACARTAH